MQFIAIASLIQYIMFMAIQNNFLATSVIAFEARGMRALKRGLSAT